MSKSLFQGLNFAPLPGFERGTLRIRSEQSRTCVVCNFPFGPIINTPSPKPHAATRYTFVNLVLIVVEKAVKKERGRGAICHS